MKHCLALFTIVISTTANAAGVYLIGQRSGISATGQPVKICIYGEPQEAELQIQPFAACPPSIEVLNAYTSGNAGAIDAQSQRTIPDAQTKALQQSNPQIFQSAAPPLPSTSEQRAQWADEWGLWLRQNLDLCFDNQVVKQDQCRRIASKTYKDAIACNDGYHELCRDRDNDLIELGRWQRSDSTLHASQPNAESLSTSQVSALQSQLNMQRCLNQVTDRAITLCRENNCDMTTLTNNIAAAKRAQCRLAVAQ
jgi:hypothetical protein